MVLLTTSITGNENQADGSRMNVQSPEITCSVLSDKGYPVPSNETQRLQSLLDLGILDTPPDERFDRIVRLASGHFDMPVCRVSFVDVDRNWFKASVGMAVSQAPRAIAICSHAIMEDGVLVSRDLAEDPRFSNSPQVTGGPKFRFYAGAPIILGDGMRVGSLCIMDKQPHPEFTQDDAVYLADLAAIVTHELELHRRSDEKVQRLLEYDVLTELPNRAYSRDILQNTIHQAIDEERKMALLCIDLDGFKEVNDTRGHLIGDRVLTEIGVRLSRFAGERIVAGRLSGDEFVVIVKDFGQDSDLVWLGHEICQAIAVPIRLEHEVIDISASIGISIGPSPDGELETLVQFSDLALYHAKSEGGNCHRFFEEVMYTSAKERQRLACDLRQAIRNDELILHYQPLVDLHDCEIIGYEALLRWRHSKLGMISPLQFIGLAEETGQICDIGEWVLRTACEYAVTWPNKEKVSVNLSPVQFKRQNVVSIVKAVLLQTGLEPERLELENYGKCLNPKYGIG